MGSAALSGDDRFIPDFKVPGKPGLSSHPNPSAQPGRSGQPHLSGKHAVWAHVGPMSYLHQVVQFGSAVDQGIPDCSAIDSRIGADLHVVFYYDSPRLADFIKASIFCRRKTKSVAADHHPVLKNYPISNQASLTNNYMGMKHAS